MEHLSKINVVSAKALLYANGQLTFPCLDLQCIQDAASPDVSRQESTILAEHGGLCSASIPMVGHSMSNTEHSNHSLGSSPDAITPQAESIKAKPQWHNAAAAGSSAPQV